VLLVPSVLAPNENNWLINSAHPDYKRIVVREVEPLSYDPAYVLETTQPPPALIIFWVWRPNSAKVSIGLLEATAT
jgi:hypothetical protein